ncbi:MAG: family 10 glycosylhydrolase [Dysgonomonas sp.]
MKQYFTLTFLLLLFSSFSFSQNTPERELRSVWLSTVWRIDWPSSLISTTGNASQINKQKQEMINLLDSLASVNMNTVFFQVRSRCDAMYKSSYEPWSTDLVNLRGKDPGYDPLQFVIEEGHKRGIEVHAWMNPYRFESATDQWKGKVGDYREVNPDWVLQYPVNSDGQQPSILNPGEPGVIQRITDIVGEIVNNYDVDGIAFDDYFYSYDGTPSTLDKKAQDKYRPINMSISDWRRNNIAKMVASVYDTIQKVKPYVTFGISPFGIWTTDKTVAAKEGITLPSGITGANMYEQIYCDPVSWMKAGTVDYISPQLYWPTTSSGQSYNTLCPWWSDLAARFNVHFYSSHSISALDASKSASSYNTGLIKVGDEYVSKSSLSMRELMALNEMTSDSQLKDMVLKLSPNEYAKQIDKNRSSDKMGAPGSVFFSAKHFYSRAGTSMKDYYNPAFMKQLRNNQFKYKSLPPAIDWKTHVEYSKVTNLKLNGNQLTWDAPDPGLRYSIYLVPTSATDFETNRIIYLEDISYVNQYNIPSDKLADYKYGVAVFDRYGNEFEIKFYDQYNSIEDYTLSEPKAFVYRQGDNYLLRVNTNVNVQDHVSVSLYNMSGSKIADIVSQKTTGLQEYVLPGDIANGTYLILITTPTQTKSLKFIK